MRLLSMEDGSVDFDAYRDLINWQIEKGIDAIIACGTSGEASTMDDEEHVANGEVLRRHSGRKSPCHRRRRQ